MCREVSWTVSKAARACLYSEPALRVGHRRRVTPGAAARHYPAAPGAALGPGRTAPPAPPAARASPGLPNAAARDLEVAG